MSRIQQKVSLLGHNDGGNREQHFVFPASHPVPHSAVPVRFSIQLDGKLPNSSTRRDSWSSSEQAQQVIFEEIRIEVDQLFEHR